MDEDTFTSIKRASTDKEEWGTLRAEFQGDSTLFALKAQPLRHDFEVMQMRSSEGVQSYVLHVRVAVNRVRAYGEEVKERAIVTKVLRSLHLKYNYVVIAITEAKDLTKITLDELSSSQQTHEGQMNYTEVNDDDVFQVKERGVREEANLASQLQDLNLAAVSLGRGFTRGRGHRRGRGKNPFFFGRGGFARGNALNQVQNNIEALNTDRRP